MTFTSLRLLLPACALLAACSTLPAGDAGRGLPAGPSAAYRDTVTLSGQIAVHYTHDEQPQHMSGTYRWVQQGARTDVTLLSPLGQTVAVISVTPQQATLTQSGQPVRTAADIDILTTQVLGWPLPVAGLREWLQGRATDAQGQPFVASRTQDSVTTRDGWRIRYIWQDTGDAIRRIDLERAMPGQATPVSLRITIVESA
jgi:outer membrane lipoprotein LolB